ncbi:hypothetical protein GCM10020218_024380 [Dactylosporangium vinaceum]
MSDLPQNCWTLAEYARDATPDRMQRLLDTRVAEHLRRDARVRDFVVQQLADTARNQRYCAG